MGPRLMVSMAAVMRNTLALIIPEHGARCVEGGAEKRVSQSMTTMHWELAALRRPEELRGEDGGWMSYFAWAETVPGMGPAWQRVWCNKARWDLNKTNKSGCCFTPGWLQPDFRLTSQKRNSFIPNINLSFRLYFCYISEISEKLTPADEEYLINSKKGRKTLNVCWPGASRDLEASRETG